MLIQLIIGFCLFAKSTWFDALTLRNLEKCNLCITLQVLQDGESNCDYIQQEEITS